MLRERPLSASGCRRDRSADCTTPTSRYLGAEPLQHQPPRENRARAGAKAGAGDLGQGEGRSGTLGVKAKAVGRAAQSGTSSATKPG